MTIPEAIICSILFIAMIASLTVWACVYTGRRSEPVGDWPDDYLTCYGNIAVGFPEATFSESTIIPVSDIKDEGE